MSDVDCDCGDCGDCGDCCECGDCGCEDGDCGGDCSCCDCTDGCDGCCDGCCEGCCTDGCFSKECFYTCWFECFESCLDSLCDNFCDNCGNRGTCCDKQKRKKHWQDQNSLNNGSLDGSMEPITIIEQPRCSVVKEDSFTEPMPVIVPEKPQPTRNSSVNNVNGNINTMSDSKQSHVHLVDAVDNNKEQT